MQIQFRSLKHTRFHRRFCEQTQTALVIFQTFNRSTCANSGIADTHGPTFLEQYWQVLECSKDQELTKMQNLRVKKLQHECSNDQYFCKCVDRGELWGWGKGYWCCIVFKTKTTCWYVSYRCSLPQRICNITWRDGFQSNNIDLCLTAIEFDL